MSKARGGSSTSMMDLQAIKTLKSDIPGNANCVDCGAPSKLFFITNRGQRFEFLR